MGHNSQDFGRVYGDDQDRAHRCPECDTWIRIWKGSAAGLVIEKGEKWVLLPRSGTRVRRRALGPVSVLERFDAILGYDTEDCAHLWDRTNGRVSVRYHGVEKTQFDVTDDRASLAAYLQWLEREHEREWWPETMPEWALDALRGGDRA